MTGNAKRKWRWSSKSVFASSPSSKVRLLDQMAIQTQDGATDRDSTNGFLLDGCSTDELSQKSGVAARMRRNGSKLLSIVGFQKFDGRVIKDCSNAPSDRDVAITIARDAAAPTLFARSLNDDVRTSVLHGRQGETAAPHNCVTEDPLFQVSPAARIEGTHIAPMGDQEVVPKPSKSPPSNPCKAHDDTGGLWKSRSNSGFTAQLSHKLSTTFGNPTVVHRPNMRTRPALLSVHEGPLPGPNVFDVQLSSPLESTTPSSYNTSGSISTGYASTAKTSLDSNITSMRSPNSFRANEGSTDIENLALTEDIFPEKPLTPIPERLPVPAVPAVVQPTVVTVETTANTKIFLETHFNALLAGHSSPRSLRRQGLVSRLENQSTNEEQRRREVAKWATCESEHLRQTRVLKTKASAMNPGSGAASAGYEVIRVLGKGSFGVVRLVREKDYNLLDTTNAQSTSFTNTNEKHTTREDLVSLKTTAIEALKASLDSQRMGLGRTNMKAGKEVYAMKVIRKSDMLRNCQEGHLRAERDFLVASESSSWVVPLIASFEDSINLYLVMEYMVGGDFLGLLFRKDILKERHARWYIAEMILCVEEAHKLRWIHRDVKPDNFLISASGHLKISDFGLAFDGHWAHDQRYFKDHRQSLMDKLGITVKGDSQDQEEDAQKDVQSKMADILNDRKGRHHESQVDGPGEHEPILQWRNRHGRRKLAGSVVGTSQYMAPEVVRGHPYDGRCDWWSIGIILYECLYGFTPFVCEKREDTKAKILDNAKTLVFPDEKEVDRREKVSYDAMELINSLLQEKEHRLSSKKYLLNDYQHSRRSPGQLVGKRADLFAQDYQGNYVYPDDANDIKAHHFFRRISWDRLHLTRPPFVPDVNGCDDTKYFDDEEPISDVNDADSQSHISDSSAKDTMDGANEAMDVTQVDGAQGEGARRHDPATACCVTGRSENRVEIARPGAKKRPRDKVLRDRALGRTALELRKKGAFLGYAYRRANISL